MNRIVLLFLCLAFGLTLEAQITKSSMSGLVKDDSGIELIGANVVVTHMPSGTVYGVSTLIDGRYNIPNMRVGGPYDVEVSYIGLETYVEHDVFLTLGQRLILNIDLSTSGVQLQEIVISGTRDPVMSGDRTGSATTVTRDQITALPSISRSASDYTRLNPMSAEGGSFGGRNDQFNNYSVDGTIFNNPFGLDAATPGGQTDAQPVSLDAIDQIQVLIAPFDVTQSGFTGASVNAVTKSGTNKFAGTVYGFYRNKDLVSGKVDGEDVFKGDLNSIQTGFSLGGPIAKNKIFFFANLELENRSDLGSYFVPTGGAGGGSASRVLASDMQMVSDMLNDRFGYESGAIENFKHDANNTKGLFKLDFNISQNHKLAITYNFLDAFKDKPAHPSAIGPRGPSFFTLQMENSGYRINNKLHSGIIELNSIFGQSRFANKLQVGYTSFRDHRDPFSDPFPVLNIGKDGIRYIIAGHEPFSVNNVLNQDVFQINDQFSVYLGKHNLTFGGAFERFNFDNSFNLTSYGFRVFGGDVDIADFPDLINSGGLDGEVDAARAAFSSSNENDSWALAETNLGQFSLYAQDEINASEKLTLTLGLRMDMPLYFNTPDLIQENIDRKGGLVSDGGVYAPEVTYYDEEGNDVQFDHTELPKKTPLINPRIGFNYDIKGDRTRQLRGGTGLFSGRFPFVWIGNQVANPDFFFYNATDPDFKFVQVWNTALGYDHRFNSGWTGTIDLMYTKDINAAMVRNYGLKPPTGSLGGVDNRPVYNDSDRAKGPFGGTVNAYVFTNTSTGYQFNMSLQAQRSWKNNYMMLGYNYLSSQDAASIDAEISSDAYDRNPANITHTNTPELSPSLYGNRHRVVGALSRKMEYANGKLATTIGIFMEYVEGGRYSYTYSGDINNDGSGLNDLIYVPTDGEIDQMAFAGGNEGAQRSALKSYIAQDEYLNERRGDYAEKYGALSPWYGKWDIRFLQDFNLPSGQNVQFNFDILNFGNLVSSTWGVRQFATNTGLAQPIGVSVAGGDPVYSFDPSVQQTFFVDSGLSSRWQGQVGLRFTF